MRKRYATVKIAQELADELDKVANRRAYHSRAEIVNDAIRRFLEETEWHRVHYPRKVAKKTKRRS